MSVFLGTDQTSSTRKSITCYPNPANNTINFSEQLEYVKVYNIYGQLILSQIESVKSISVEKFTNGIYFIHSNNATLKFIVEH